MTKSDRLHFYIDLAANTVESFRDSADANYTMTYNFGDWQVSISFYQNNIKGGTATATLVPLGNNFGTCKITFKIEYPRYIVKFNANNGTKPTQI